jgi:hypothetical protein
MVITAATIGVGCLPPPKPGCLGALAVGGLNTVDAVREVRRDCPTINMPPDRRREFGLPRW